MGQSAIRLHAAVLTVIFLSACVTVSLSDDGDAIPSCYTAFTQIENGDKFSTPYSTFVVHLPPTNSYSQTHHGVFNDFNGQEYPDGGFLTFDSEGEVLIAFKFNGQQYVRYFTIKSLGNVPMGDAPLNGGSTPTYYYDLYYDANGGSGAPSSQTKTLGSLTSSLAFIVSSQEPTRSGYNFLGWSKSSTATSASYSGGDTVYVTYTGLTLYAVWEEDEAAEEPILAWTTVPSQSCIVLPTIVYADDGTFILTEVPS